MAVDLAGMMASSAAQDAAALRRVFETITAESCPLQFNFHMHTLCSDGRLEPEALIHQATLIGLKGLAITDHHSVNGYQRAQHWLSEQQQRDRNAEMPHLWTGTEINANLLNEEVHILAYAFNPDHSVMQPYLQSETTTGELYQANRVIAAVHQAGGLAVLAHPMRYRQSARDLISAAVEVGIDGVETFYAYGNPSPWQSSPKQTAEVEALSRRYQLLNTCGTDTHGLNLLQRI